MCAFRTALVALILASSQLAFADGGPVETSPTTGLMRFVHSHEAALVHKRVTITLSNPAIVRAEYDLALRERKTPLTVTVAWPIGEGLPMDFSEYPRVRPSIKFDGRPVAYNFLRFDQLAQPYLRPIIAQMDRALSTRPALAAKVGALRATAAQQMAHEKWTDDAEVQQNWIRDTGAPELSAWMKANGHSAPGSSLDVVADGLLLAGLRQRGIYDYESIQESIQSALSWLDPGYEPVDIAKLVSDQWRFQVLAVDPRTGRLVGNNSGSEPGAVFRFAIMLEPGKKHRLVVQYRQFLGMSGSDPPYGTVYQMMDPSAAWALADMPQGYQQPAEIEIRVPREWRKVGIRPPARKIGRSRGFTIYRITMDQPPLEDLYLGVDN
jgi:hypothetical protein